jgi:hypothetical protein
MSFALSFGDWAGLTNYAFFHLPCTESTPGFESL